MAWGKGYTVKTTVCMSIGNKTIPANLWSPVAATRDNVKHNNMRDGFQNLKTIQESLPEEKCPK